MMRALFEKETDDEDVGIFFKSLVKSVKKLRPTLGQRAKVEKLKYHHKVGNWNLEA